MKVSNCAAAVAAAAADVLGMASSEFVKTPCEGDRRVGLSSAFGIPTAFGSSRIFFDRVDFGEGGAGGVFNLLAKCFVSGNFRGPRICIKAVLINSNKTL